MKPKLNVDQSIAALRVASYLLTAFGGSRPDMEAKYGMRDSIARALRGYRYSHGTAIGRHICKSLKAISGCFPSKVRS